MARLATSLRGIRDKVRQLASRIAGSLPGLTIHDISHLDALWDVAGTIAGPDYPLNPLEAYVFGASVLLHDAGLCFQAYSGGQDALRDTLEWRDAHGRLSRIARGSPNLKQEADLEALRALHASKAACLATEPWRNGSHELYLIDDHALRENYGALIGDIASSHHWDLDMVLSRFKIPRPPGEFLDADWVVDSLKVACLLRRLAKITWRLLEIGAILESREKCSHTGDTGEVRRAGCIAQREDTTALGCGGGTGWRSVPSWTPTITRRASR